MNKRLLLVALVVLLLGAGLWSAQQSDRMAKYKQTMVQRIGMVAMAAAADLRPGVVVNCCTATGECGQILETAGFIIVNNVELVIYNAGGAASNPATGKVELFNWLTNAKVTRTFSVTAAPKKGWGTVTPASIVGPFLVKKSMGITASVTFTGGSQTTPKTNSKTENACYTLY